MSKDIQLYWEMGNGRVTKSKEYGGAPILKSFDDGIWIERWKIDDDHYIDFAYTQFDKDEHLVDRNRDLHFERNHVNPRILRSMSIPPKIYEQLQGEFSRC